MRAHGALAGALPCGTNRLVVIHIACSILIDRRRLPSGSNFLQELVLIYLALSIYFQLGARGPLYRLPIRRARDRSPMLRGPGAAMSPALWLHEDHVYSKRPDRPGLK